MDAIRQPGIKLVECDNAEAFLREIRDVARTGIPGGTSAGCWVFRGQRDASWHLLAPACRGDTRTRDKLSRLGRGLENNPAVDALGPDWTEPHRGRAIEHRRIGLQEICAVQRFSQLADELAYPVESVHDAFPYQWLGENTCYEYGSPWCAHAPTGKHVRTDLLQTVGLAQHHGIPTSLLDWTRRPVFAAYFAASDWVHCDGTKPERIAVWALNLNVIRLIGPPNDIHVVTCARHRTAYLHAQDALFTYDANFPRTFIQHGLRLGIDHFADNHEHCGLRDYNNIGWEPLVADKPWLSRIELRGKECVDLLERLWSERVSLAHLMPTLDRAVEMLNEPWVR